MTGSLHAKAEVLREILQGFPAMVIGYSGGVDSAVLCAAALRAVGPERMLACLAVGPSLPQRERIEAEALAAMAGFPLLSYEATEIENPAYRENGPDRCYHCKTDLFVHLQRIAEEKGFSHILYGANVDDLSDFRPGHRAAREFATAAPLAEAGVHKTEIRELAKLWNLPCHDKPASPCLSSRIPYRQEVTVEKLVRIERGEDLLFSLGFREFRLRSDDGEARIEVPLQEVVRFEEPGLMDKVSHQLQALGFKQVSVDPNGLRSGNLNTVLSENERQMATQV